MTITPVSFIWEVPILTLRTSSLYAFITLLHFFHFRTQGPITFSKGHEGSVSACNFSEDGEET